MQKLFEKLNDYSGVYFDAGPAIASVQSPFQLIEIFDTPELGRLMRIDGCNMTSERDEFFYHENLVHPAAIAHPDPRDVLVIGGGDGGSAEEILKYPSVERCRLCELDPTVIDLARTHLPNVHRGVFDHPKLDIHIGDGLAYLHGTSDRYDLIYLDLTDPVGPAEALYTQDFYRDCQRALAPIGAVTLHLGSPFSHPARVQLSLANLRAVFKTVTPYFVHIPVYGAVWGFACASDTIDIAAIGGTEIDDRLAERGIGARQFYNGAMHVAMQALPEYVRGLIS
jgi:spermidine synthase